MERWNYTKS